MSVLCRNTANFTGPELMSDGLIDKDNMLSSRASLHFSLFGRKMCCLVVWA